MQRYKIEGIMCPHDQKRVGTAIASLPGVEIVDIDLDRKEASVRGEASPLKVMEAVTALGYQITPIQ